MSNRNFRARSTAAGITIVFVASVLMAILSYVHAGKPLPVIHDEMVNLLEADTLAHGRLANPPHPMASHLETFHVLQSPTYAGKFPLALPMFMALGQRLWDPLLGVWLSVACGCAAVCWMLLACFPPRWAVAGGVWTAAMPIVHLWQTSYYGGGPAMLGGALVCGAAIRALRRPSFPNAATMAAGAAVLFNSRPFEGALLCALIGVALSGRAVGRPAWAAAFFFRFVVAAGVMLAALLSFNLYNNFRVTGSLFTLPYTLHARQYMKAPLMFWQPPHEPLRDAPEPLRTFHRRLEFDEYQQQLGWSGFLRHAGVKATILVRTYTFSHWLDAPLLAGLLFWRSSRIIRGSWCVGTLLVLLVFCSTPWFRWNYVAPLMGLFSAALMESVRRVSQLRAGAFPAGAVAAGLYVAAFLHASLTWSWQRDASAADSMAVFRQVIVTDLQRAGAKHLVLVGYDPHQPASMDLVFNTADVDAASIVFARDLGTVKNEELLAYYPDRRIWRVDGMRMTSYPR